MDYERAYLDFKKKQQDEVNAFPMAFAFNDEQLQKALEKLGAKVEECVTVCKIGDIMKKSDVPAYYEMVRRHKKELHEAMKDINFAEAAFLYEMNNHEYAINWTGDKDILACFYMDIKLLNEMGLVNAWKSAEQKHMKHAEECGMI